MIYLQLFSSSTSRTLHANYHFVKAKDISDLCAKDNRNKEKNQTPILIDHLEVIETMKSKLNLHHDIGTLLQSKQALILKGKSFSVRKKNNLS